MGNLKSGTRLVQNNDLKKKGDFELYNNQLNKRIIINSKGAKVLKEYHRCGIILKKDEAFFDELRNLGFIDDNSKGENIFLGEENENRYILSNLNLEITDACNLNCIHCYGSYGKVTQPNFLSFSWLKDQIKVFNRLHINSFSITGGESTCNKDFMEIVLFLLKNGFEICVFTNGLNYSLIKELLQKTKQYYFTIKVSLDGFVVQHNFIRGNAKSYEFAIKTINEITRYPNVALYISTVVMEANLKILKEFNQFISKNYPKAMHTTDLVFPSGEASGCSFNDESWKEFRNEAPELFKVPEKKKRKKRCSGGISQATLMPDGRLKICNAACDEDFYFKYNVFESGLENVWLNCGENVDFFRKEKDKETEDCKKCSYKRKCFITDCRVLANAYKHDFKKSNPLSCFITKEVDRK